MNKKIITIIGFLILVIAILLFANIFWISNWGKKGTNCLDGYVKESYTYATFCCPDLNKDDLCDWWYGNDKFQEKLKQRECMYDYDCLGLECPVMLPVTEPYCRNNKCVCDCEYNMPMCE